MSQALRPWRTAASVMIAARNRPVLAAAGTSHTPGRPADEDRHGFNYKMLILKRSSKSKFMPSAYVFPGGKVSDSDFSPDWLQVFKEAGREDVLSPRNLVKASLDKRPPVFGETFSDSGVVNDLAFRICAIRETFEESGVLICKGADHMKAEDLNEWRHTVHEDASKFIELCRQFGVTPDVWSLHDWSNWLTPTNMEELHSGRRFDTLFYMCCLPELREMAHDEKEITFAEWQSPATILQEYHRCRSWLAPPQIYELSRLCKFTDVAELSQFAKQREDSGTERWMPVRMTCTDGMITVLPGDALYPAEPDVEGKHPSPDVNQSLAESLRSSRQQHRLELRDLYECPIRCNVAATHGHMAPMLLDEFRARFGSSEE